jgi:uncharacterized protein (DUF2336 family)
MDADQSLIAELEAAIKSGSKDKRVGTLRRITDLFVADADRLNDRQIAVFDDVLGHVIKRIEGKALAELSRRLGPISNAPVDVVQRLARHDDITIAEPILTQSARLNDKDLLEIANTKTQAHLLAISGRSQIGAAVTDVLLQRGDAQVVHKLAENSGARFSESGYHNLVKHSGRDERLSEKVGLRLDLPPQLFRDLLSRATEAVRSRLLAVAVPESRNRIQRVLANISEDAHHKAGIRTKQDYSLAYAQALVMRQKGTLSEATLLDAVKKERGAEMLATLSLLCGAPLPLVQNLLQNEHREAFLIPCKAAGLEWQTVRLMLASPLISHKISEQDFELARAEYAKLSQPSAQRVLRFWQVRQTVSDNAAATSPSSVTPTAKPRISAGR